MRFQIVVTNADTEWANADTEGCVPKIVLAVKIAQWRQLLPPTLRNPFAKAPIAQGFDRDQHNLWDTTLG
jgi:hypothetical protein